MSFGDPLVIPVLADTPLFSLRVQLDGVDFQLGFDYSGREDRYYLSVSDADGDLIVGGLKVVDNWFLLTRVADSRRPMGDIMALQTDGYGPPGLNDIGPGRRVQMLYLPLIVDVGSGIKPPTE